MSRLARRSDRLWCILMLALLAAGTDLTIAHFARSADTLNLVVLMGLLAIPVACRIVKGTTADAESRMLEKLRARRGQRSRFLERQLSKSQRKAKSEWDQLLEPGETVILELRRSPLVMVSPAVMVMLVAAVLKVLLIGLKGAASAAGGYGVAGFFLVLGLLGYVVWPFRFWVLVSLGIALVIVVLVMIRFWSTQTLVFTDRQWIRFEGIQARPVRTPYTAPNSFQTVRPTLSKAATWLRLAGVPWDEVLVFLEKGSSPPRHAYTLKGYTGAELVFEHILGPEWERIAEAITQEGKV